ncbi:MAG: hypothetical protein ACREFI_08805 [Stellaceae bacterium]
MMSLGRNRGGVEFVPLTRELFARALEGARDFDAAAAISAGVDTCDPEASAILWRPDCGWALMEGVRCLGTGGVLDRGGRRGVLWLMPALGITPRPFAATLPAVRAWLRRLLIGGPFLRLEAEIRADYPKACLWIERLGFTRECTLEKFALGRDFFLYSLVDLDLRGGSAPVTTPKRTLLGVS